MLLGLTSARSPLFVGFLFNAGNFICLLIDADAENVLTRLVRRVRSDCHLPAILGNYSATSGDRLPASFICSHNCERIKTLE